MNADEIDRETERLIDPVARKVLEDALRQAQDALAARKAEPTWKQALEQECVVRSDQEFIGPAILRALQELKRPEGVEKKRGRRRGDERTGPALVLAALVKHHGLQEDGSVATYEPAPLATLEELSGVSRQTCSNFLANKLGRPGYKHYKAKCVQDTIGPLLVLWLGEVPKMMADLLAEEYGRRREDD